MMKVKMKLDPARVLRFISETRGKFFHVVYRKKDGSERKMTARISVSKNLKGTGLKFDPIQRNILPVFDLNAKDREGNKGAYRMINLDSVIEITIAGDTIINKESV